MPTPISYLSGNTLSYQSGMVKKGTIGLNLTSSLTGNYKWWNGVDATSSQYLIYSDTYSTGASSEANVTPAAWSTPDLTDQSLLNLINTLPDRVGQTAFTTLSNALIWLNESGKYFVVRNGYENIVTSGLTLNLDAGWTNSYATGTTTWNDLSGSGNTFTLLNGVDFNSADYGSLTFDGTDDYTKTSSSFMNGATQGTFEFWFQTSSISGGGSYYFHRNCLIGKASGPDNGLGFSTTSNRLRLRLGADSNLDSTIELNTNVIYHVVGTWDSGGSKLYINGVLNNSNNTANLSWYTSQFETIIGRVYVGSAGASFTGKIYSARAYNRALSQSEILQNYHVTKQRFGFNNIVGNGLVLNLNSQNTISYPTSGTSWYDLTGNNNTGTLTNGPTFDSTTRSIVFDGADDRVLTPINVSNWAVVPFTIMSTFKWVSGGSNNNHGWFELAGAGGSNWGLTHVPRTGSFYFYWIGNGEGAGHVVSNSAIQDNIPLHMAITFNGIGGNNQNTLYNNTKIYINGVLQSHVNGGGAGIDSNSSINIGGTYYPFKGSMQYFQYYNRQLSDAEVLQNYYQGNIVTNGLISALDGGNLVSYGTTGTSIYDLSNTYSGGTLWNGPTYNTSNGGFLTFDGTDDYISCGTQLSGATQFSFTIVFKTTDTRSAGNWYNNPAICGTAQGGGTSGDFLMAVRNGYLVQFDELIPNGGENNYDTGVYVSDGNWKVLQVTKSTAGVIKFFVNGLNVGQVTGRTQPLRFYDNSSPFHPYGAQWEISRAYWSGSLNLSGSIGLQHLYNRTLTDSEVIQNFNAIKSRYGL